MTILTSTRVGTEISVDDGSMDVLGDWYCLKFMSFTKCVTCGCVIKYVESPYDHRVVVWPERDDLEMLKLADYVQRVFKKNIKVVAFEGRPNDCISFYALWSRIQDDKNEFTDGCG
jgi:hypothetical protein